MNTTIRKGTSSGKSENIAIFTNNASKFDQSLFSKAELEFVNSEIKKKNKFISINQYERYIFLQIIDTDKKDRHVVLEKFRKAGDQLTALLNRLKLSSVCLLSENDNDEVIAYVEGMVLGNYQFLKYKSDADKNSFHKIVQPQHLVLYLPGY